MELRRGAAPLVALLVVRCGLAGLAVLLVGHCRLAGSVVLRVVRCGLVGLAVLLVVLRVGPAGAGLVAAVPTVLCIGRLAPAARGRVA